MILPDATYNFEICFVAMIYYKKMCIGLKTICWKFSQLEGRLEECQSDYLPPQTQLNQKLFTRLSHGGSQAWLQGGEQGGHFPPWRIQERATPPPEILRLKMLSIWKKGSQLINCIYPFFKLFELNHQYVKRICF